MEGTDPKHQGSDRVLACTSAIDVASSSPASCAEHSRLCLADRDTDRHQVHSGKCQRGVSSGKEGVDVERTVLALWLGKFGVEKFLRCATGGKLASVCRAEASSLSSGSLLITGDETVFHTSFCLKVRSVGVISHW